MWTRSSAVAIAHSCIGVLAAALESRCEDHVILNGELRSRAAQRGRSCLFSRLLQSERQFRPQHSNCAGANQSGLRGIQEQSHPQDIGNGQPQFRAGMFNILNRANFAPPVLPDQTDIFNADGTSNGSAG
jgi:hypothetical protein